MKNGTGVLLAIFIFMVCASGAPQNKRAKATACTPVTRVSSTENSLTIHEQAGLVGTNYPIQIGRPFKPGEIPHKPQVLIDGSPIPTQADIKCRWPDGSVKHAILSFLIPRLPAAGQVRVTFRNRAGDPGPGRCPGACLPELLGANQPFDARIVLKNVSGEEVAVSAGEMLAKGCYTYWMEGPIAISLILADHSAEGAFDLGFDGHRSFRPIFHATFWPSIGKGKIRFIGEVANTEALQDIYYALELRMGFGTPEKVYGKTFFNHPAATRWSKTFWFGGEPSAIAIDHNLDYLTETRFIPNFDRTKKITNGTIASAYAKWQSSSRDLFDAGLLPVHMGLEGGRRDIGPYPSWTVQWLYTGDERLREIAFGHADLAAAYPLHLRESKPGKNLLRTDPPGAGTGMGKVLSISNRPSVCLWSGYDFAYTAPSDRVTVVGGICPYFKADGAHQPDPFSPQYLLTGEFWYLEEMYFWASYSAARYHPGGFYGRGPTGAEGGIHDETRGDGWVFRNRVQTAFLAPDEAPEKSYFTTLVNDAIAIWEGQRSVMGTPHELSQYWNWGQAMKAEEFGGLGVPPLHHWDRGHPGLVQAPVDAACSKEATSTWEEHIMLYALGRARELGYPTDGLISWFSSHLIGMLTDPCFDPYLVAAYRIPTVCQASGDYFQTWADLQSGFEKNYQGKGKFQSYLKDAEHGYCFMALAAASMVFHEPGGEEAWTWIAEQALSAPSLDKVPKWALLPRGGTPRVGELH